MGHSCTSFPFLQKLACLKASRHFFVAVSGALRDVLSDITNMQPSPTYAAQLERLLQATRAQLSSRQFWAHIVEQGLLPTLLIKASAAEER